MEKLGNWLKKYSVELLLLVVMIITFLVIQYQVNTKEVLYYKEYELSKTAETVKENNLTEVGQEFIANYDYLKQVKISFDSLERRSHDSHITIGIKQGNKVLKEERITDNDFRGRSYYTLKFDEVKDSKGKLFYLYIKYDNYLDGNLLVRFLENSNSNQVFFVNGEVREGSLAIQNFYGHPTKTMVFYGNLIVLFLILYSVIIFCYHKKMKLETIFLVVAPLIYFSYILFMPTFTNHDELYHWYRAYEVSEGKLLTEVQNKYPLSNLSESIGKIYNKDFLEIRYSNTYEAFKVQNDENKSNFDMSTVAVYSPVQYSSQVLGIKLAQIFTDRPMIWAYAGRMMNALVSIILLYFAIKLIPFGKKLLFTLPFIPIAIEGFTSLSPDGLTISIAFLFMAYLFQLLFNKKRVFQKKDYIILLILGTILSLCKIVYLPIVALLLLFTKKQMGGFKRYLAVIGSIIGICTVANLVWLGIASRYLVMFRSGDSVGQVKFILTHFITYFQIFLATIAGNFDHYFLSLFGGELGWSEVIRPFTLLPFGFCLLTILATVFDSSLKQRFSIKENTIIGLISLLVIALIFTSLFVQWTPLHSMVIEGVQGRYLLPVLPLIYFFFGNFGKKKESKNVDIVIVSGCVIMNLIVIFDIFIHFL